MGHLCLGRSRFAHDEIHVEVRLRHAEVNDIDDARASTEWRDAQDQRALSLQRVWSGTAHGDGAGRRSTTTQALLGRDGHDRTRFRIGHQIGSMTRPQTVDKRVGNYTFVILLSPTPHGVADGLVVLGGCVQATQKRGES